MFRPPLPVGVRNRGDWGYFVECKIVDGAASIGLYCTQGVERFTSGAYAAWMPSGGMLAYVRDGTRPFASLKARFAKGYSTQHHLHRSADTSDSMHGRGALPTPCVDIALVHLWLSTSWPSPSDWSARVSGWAAVHGRPPILVAIGANEADGQAS